MDDKWKPDNKWKPITFIDKNGDVVVLPHELIKNSSVLEPMPRYAPTMKKNPKKIPDISTLHLMLILSHMQKHNQKRKERHGELFYTHPLYSDLSPKKNFYVHHFWSLIQHISYYLKESKEKNLVLDDYAELYIYTQFMPDLKLPEKNSKKYTPAKHDIYTKKLESIEIAEEALGIPLDFFKKRIKRTYENLMLYYLIEAQLAWNDTKRDDERFRGGSINNFGFVEIEKQYVVKESCDWYRFYFLQLYNTFHKTYVTICNDLKKSYEKQVEQRKKLEKDLPQSKKMPAFTEQPRIIINRKEEPIEAVSWCTGFYKNKMNINADTKFLERFEAMKKKNIRSRKGNFYKRADFSLNVLDTFLDEYLNKNKKPLMLDKFIIAYIDNKSPLGKKIEKKCQRYWE